jgi:hypothetical protein
MAKSPPTAPTDRPDAAKTERPPPAQSSDEVRAGVQAQRRRIAALTGEDPLRGGVAD